MSDAPAAVAPAEIKLSGVRAMIAERMMSSLAGTAQVTFHADADITELLQRRALWKQAGLAISIEDCVVAALARALSANPSLNGAIEGDRAILSDAVHVAAAVAVDGMLLAPVIRNAQALDLLAISAQRQELVGLARSRRLPVTSMKGGTTTVSNLGVSSVRYFTPILNGGQLTILGVGRTDECLALDGAGEVTVRRKLCLSLTVDHRFVDGEPAARMLTELCGLLETMDHAV